MRQSPDMRVVLQRVGAASVRVDGEEISKIGAGLCLLVGISANDTMSEVEAAVSKISALRVFADHEAKMNLSVADVGGEILVVSQFTLYADVRRGRRPSFTDAAPPHLAAPLVEAMAAAFRQMGLRTSEGVFGAVMELEMINDGPVTLVLDVEGGAVR